MEENKELVLTDKSELLNIFPKEEDKKGSNVLEMSDFFEVYIEKIEPKIKKNTPWEFIPSLAGMEGAIANAIKSGVDISKIGVLVADHSHFSQDIIDGLKNGIYRIGQSKEVAGNLRPAIVDLKGKLVKFFTLKKAFDPSCVLGDISTLSMQFFLQRISLQLEDIGRDVQEIIGIIRQEELSNKFLYARDKIMLASEELGERRERYLDEADTYLLEGLTDLYADVDRQVKKLAEFSGLFQSVKEIDKSLSYFNEDMQLIPRYVGLRVYLFNYRGKTGDANRVLGDYRYLIEELSKRDNDEKISDLELIHQYYPYEKTNVDFWIDKPKQMLQAIELCENMLSQKDQDLYYIDVED